MTWVQTASGSRVDFMVPKPRQIKSYDIGHGLAMKCRFGGHVKSLDLFYTVAQHCINVARILPPEARLCAILHDAPEAFLSDVVSHLKRELQPLYGNIESKMLACIESRYQCHPTKAIRELVHKADMYMLFWEGARLLEAPERMRDWAVRPPTDFTPFVDIEDEALNVMPRQDAMDHYLDLLNIYNSWEHSR